MIWEVLRQNLQPWGLPGQENAAECAADRHGRCGATRSGGAEGGMGEGRDQKELKELSEGGTEGGRKGY
eukprot:763005-Hanusia_phi.AAC.2